MTIAFPGPSKFDLGALFGRRTRNEKSKPHALDAKDRKRLKMEIAQRFRKTRSDGATPARLNDSELEARARMTDLRGALYDKK